VVGRPHPGPTIVEPPTPGDAPRLVAVWHVAGRPRPNPTEVEPLSPEGAPRRPAALAGTGPVPLPCPIVWVGALGTDSATSHEEDDVGEQLLDDNDFLGESVIVRSNNSGPFCVVDDAQLQDPTWLGHPDGLLVVPVCTGTAAASWSKSLQLITVSYTA